MPQNDKFWTQCPKSTSFGTSIGKGRNKGREKLTYEALFKVTHSLVGGPLSAACSFKLITLISRASSTISLSENG